MARRLVLVCSGFEGCSPSQAVHPLDGRAAQRIHLCLVRGFVQHACPFVLATLHASGLFVLDQGVDGRIIVDERGWHAEMKTKPHINDEASELVIVSRWSNVARALHRR